MTSSGFFISTVVITKYSGHALGEDWCNMPGWGWTIVSSVGISPCVQTQLSDGLGGSWSSFDHEISYSWLFLKKKESCIGGKHMTMLHTGAACVLVMARRLCAMDTHIHVHPMTLPICPHFVLEGLCWERRRESLSAWSPQSPCLHLQHKSKLITSTSHAFVLRVSTQTWAWHKQLISQRQLISCQRTILYHFWLGSQSDMGPEKWHDPIFCWQLFS